MTDDRIKEHIICINGGSGVIFQPIDNKYSYILTARHVFDDIAEIYNNNVNAFRFDGCRNEFVEIPKFSLELGSNYFPHPQASFDIAILKINRIDNNSDLIIASDFDDPDGYFLVGFPKRRRNTSNKIVDWISAEKISSFLLEKSASKREADFSKVFTYEEIVGHSGAGIFKSKNGYFQLIGIENNIPNKDEQLGRVEFSPLRAFDEIITSSNGLLEPLLPSYLKSFSFLKDDIFDLPYNLITQKTIEQIRKALMLKINQTVKSDFTPLCVKEFLGVQSLIISGQDEDLIYKKHLWLRWLEVFTILNIVDDKNINKESFEVFFGKVRLLHSDTDQDFWVEHLEDIAKTEFSNLSNNGVVVISSNRPPHREHYVLDSKIIPKIDDLRDDFEAANFEFAYGREDTKISNASNFPYDRYKFVHIEYFKQKSIVDEYKEYSESKLSLLEILQLLRSKYGRIFS